MNFDLSDFKSVRLLHERKQRYERRIYLAEGSRLVLDLMKNNPAHLLAIYATDDWIAAQNAKLSRFSDIVVPVKPSRLQSISSLKSTEEVLAVVSFPDFGSATSPESLKVNYYLDNIRDPGNLGTILRTADWFGIKVLYCSPGCADPFNSKTVQSSMGSVARVCLIELQYEELHLSGGFSGLISTAAHGVDFRSVDPAAGSLICLGNEASGISQKLEKLCSGCISIPSASLGAESLNVGVAAGILMSRYSCN